MKKKAASASKSASRSTRRSICPVACTLDLIGDKWTLLVIRDLFAGRTHFSQFAQSPERIATNILADRLQRLTEAGLVDRVAPESGVGKDVYRLTDLGRSLLPVLEAVARWGLANIRGTRAMIQPV